MNCKKCGKWAGAHATLPGQSMDHLCMCPPLPVQEPYDQTALELCEVCGWKTLIPSDACLNCERKAQPVQEPVACVHVKDGLLVGSHRDGSKPFPDGQYGLWPLAAPPQRPWVGLTRREFDEATSSLEDLEDCWIAIESKLKEKNNG